MYMYNYVCMYVCDCVLLSSYCHYSIQCIFHFIIQPNIVCVPQLLRLSPPTHRLVVGGAAVYMAA